MNRDWTHCCTAGISLLLRSSLQFDLLGRLVGEPAHPRLPRVIGRSARDIRQRLLSLPPAQARENLGEREAVLSMGGVSAIGAGYTSVLPLSVTSVLRSTSKTTAVDQPNNSTPFIAVMGPSKCQRSTGVTSPYPRVV